ncbi:MAG: DUF4173 domain-containing protein [Armatimonadetes bacterium]|nr:DUF4173 domain-containing protein [Armatimonadota bacterium]
MGGVAGKQAPFQDSGKQPDRAPFYIMASAFQRVFLYQSKSGMTEARFYAIGFMVWLAVVFLWFAATVSRGQRERFVFGAGTIGLLAIFGLNLLNPDAYIVRTNLKRARLGHKLEMECNASLSLDSVPAIVAGFPP